MDKQKYIEDIAEIKDIMERSSRFISLSGLSGVIAGIVALIAVYLAYDLVYVDQDYLGYRSAQLNSDTIFQLLAIASGAIVLSIGIAVFLTNRKAVRIGQSIYDYNAKRLVVNMLIPLVTGGILCLVLLLRGYLVLLAPLTLIFYGLALVNASKYTVVSMRNLGLVEIVLGLIATIYAGYGLLFWGVGFGLVHIVYGIIMYINDRK